MITGCGGFGGCGDDLGMALPGVFFMPGPPDKDGTP